MDERRKQREERHRAAALASMTKNGKKPPLHEGEEDHDPTEPKRRKKITADTEPEVDVATENGRPGRREEASTRRSNVDGDWRKARKETRDRTREKVLRVVPKGSHASVTENADVNRHKENKHDKETNKDVK